MLVQALFAEREARTSDAVAVGRIGTADYPTPARRPANSRLSGGKLARAYGIVLPDWRESAKVVLDRLL